MSESEWDKIRSVFEDLLENPLTISNLPAQRYMQAYTSIVTFCTKTQVARGQYVSASKSPGACFKGAELYQAICDLFGEFLEKQEMSLKEIEDGDLLINRYTTLWSAFVVSTRVINTLANYLNRYYVPRNNKRYISQVALSTWNEKITMPYVRRLVNAVITVIEHSRNKDIVDLGPARLVLHSLVVVGSGDIGTDLVANLALYKTEFEQVFLSKTEVYFRRKANAFLLERNATPKEFLKMANKWIDDEIKLSEILEPSSRPLLLEVVTEAVVTANLPLLWTQFDTLLDEFNIPLLRILFRLLQLVSPKEPYPKGALPHVHDKFEEFIAVKGRSAVEQVIQSMGQDLNEVVKVYVPAILSVYHHYQPLVVEAFASDADMFEAFDKGFRAFVNKNAACADLSRSPELFARYCDTLLKRTAKNPQGSDLDQVLTDVITLFRYLEEKDCFQRFYSKFLARRLINSLSVSDDAETLFISKLKELCGHEFTQHMQRMFTDITVSSDLTRTFAMSANDPTFDNFNMLVLATKAWPLSPSAFTINLPTQFALGISAFNDFYQQKHSGRRLTWLHHLSRCEVKAMFSEQRPISSTSAAATTTTPATVLSSPPNAATDGKDHGPRLGASPDFISSQRISKPARLAHYLLTMSLTQYVILQPFNSATSLSFNELESDTGLPSSLLSSHLNLLLSPLHILATPSPEESFEPSTVFTLNTAFKNRKMKLNINLPIKNEAQKETAQTYRNVEMDRRILIQAAIVRIMKARKQIDHNTLLTEVISQLSPRFKPTIPKIKQCIDVLIEKEYLERNEAQINQYNYLA